MFETQALQLCILVTNIVLVIVLKKDKNEQKETGFVNFCNICLKKSALDIEKPFNRNLDAFSFPTFNG